MGVFIELLTSKSNVQTYKCKQGLLGDTSTQKKAEAGQTQQFGL